MEGMKQYPDKYFDLAVVDPPYGIGEDGLKNHSRGKAAKPKLYTPKNWDSHSPEQAYFNEVIRVSKNQIIWGANHFICNIPFNSPAWIVWDKMNGENDFADCELAWTNYSKAVRKFNFRWAGMLQGNMKNKEIRLHPTQKPVALYDWIYHNYLPNGGKVIDTHGGSMSNVISALKTGNIEIDCYEIDPEYFKAAQARIKTFFAQQNMYVQTPEIIFHEEKKI